MGIAIGFLATVGLVGVVAVLGRLIERTRPTRALQPAHLRFDATYAVCHLVIVGALAPAAAIIAASVVRAAGGGLITLPNAGLAGAGSFAVYVLARDFLEYAFHRAQHAIPALWAMHSLHHSEPAYNVLTSWRHFWVEPALKAALLYPLLAIVFDVPPAFVGIASVIYLANHFCAHLNVSASFGRFALCLMNPQYHRIHHSLDPRHFDRNFADLFPFWDALFGTAWRPATDEFPDTGLATETPPVRLVDGLIWPLRKQGRLHVDIGR